MARLEDFKESPDFRNYNRSDYMKAVLGKLKAMVPSLSEYSERMAEIDSQNTSPREVRIREIVSRKPTKEEIAEALMKFDLSMNPDGLTNEFPEQLGSQSIPINPTYSGL